MSSMDERLSSVEQTAETIEENLGTEIEAIRVAVERLAEGGE